MKSIQFRRNITIILSTCFAVILIYLLYTQVYIKNREEHMIQTRFRLLDQMGENLKAKVESYRKIAFNYEKAMFKSLNDLEILTKELDDLKKSGDNLSSTFTDRQENLKKSIQLKQDSIDNSNKVYNQDLIFYKINVGQLNDRISVCNDSIIFITDSMEFYLPGEFLLKNIAREDVFEKSLIIGDSSIIFCSFSKDLKLVYNQATKEGEKGKSLSFKSIRKSDTLFLPVDKTLKAATIHGNQCYNIALSDGDYKLFLKPVRIGNSDWFICGLVNNNEFQREKQSIAPWFIIVLSLALLVIILSLPFVKLKVMSKTEMLGTGTIIYAGFAFLLGASFLVHFLFFQAYDLSRIKENDKKLKVLSEEIKNSLSEEMKLIYQQLSEVDGKYHDYSNGDTTIYETNVLNYKAKWKINHYQYFDYIFWLDKTGMTVAQITPFSFREKLINYSYRDYFKLKDEWYWPYTDLGQNKKFRMESIVSVTSGDYKAAFSRPSDAFNQQVMVMTGRFYSLIDPIIPNGYKFCIIDKSGKVWFHSNKYQNLAENFFRECDEDKFLKAALYAEVSKSMNVSYYNNPNRIYIEPLSNLPLYLVTMYDLRMDYSNQAQVFITTLILITGLLLYLLLQVLLLLLLKRIFKYDAIPGNFQLEFINFRKSKISDYKRLIIYFFFALIIFTFIICRMPDVMAIISIFLIVTVLFTILFIHLHDFKFGSPAIYIFAFINALIVITLLIMLFQEINDWSDKYLWGILSFFILIIVLSNNKFSNLYDKLKIKPETAYSLVIMFMVIAFGVAPILKFFDISANLENNINIRYGQLELASDREARNFEFARYYKRIENIGNTGKNEDRDNAHIDRKEKGMYADFWYDTQLFDSTQALPPESAQGSEKIESLVNTFRPVYKDEFSVVSKFLLIDSIQSRSFNWKRSGASSLILLYHSPTEDIHQQQIITRAIKSTLPITSIFNPFWKNEIKFGFLKESLLFILLIAILFLLYKLILFTTRKVFGVSLIKDFSAIDFKDKVKGQINSGHPVTLINPAAFINFQQLAHKISTDFSTIDINWKDLTANSSSRTLLVRDLFKDYNDPKVFADKLEKLMECMQSSKKLIILLETNPEVVLNFYKDKTEISTKPDPKAEKKPDDNADSFRKACDLCKSFINRTVVLFVPVKFPPQVIESDEKKSDETPEEQISRELSASDYLTALQKPMEGYLSYLYTEKLRLNEIKHLIVIRISEMAEKYYQCLLETCTTEEKFVLMDMASDTIANIKNKQVIVKLLRRGLLINGKDSVELMNDSFRYYLVSAYSMHEKEAFKKAMGIGPSNWTGYKIAILLVIVALFVFIFISNQEFLQNMNKLFITLGASIAGITSLMGLLGRKGKES
jgi:hypothetical protein